MIAELQLAQLQEAARCRKVAYASRQAEAFPLRRAKENKQIAIETLQSISWIKRYLKGRWF